MNTNEFFLGKCDFPKSLPKQETIELIKRLREGDISSLDKLVEHNIKLVFFEVLRRFKYVEYDKNDLISIGIGGLMKAIYSFDLTKNVNFSTYAIRCIDNEILMFLRKLKKDKMTDSLNKTIITYKDGRVLTLEDTISDKTDIVKQCINNDIYQNIRKMVDQLPELEKKIIALHFGFYDGKTYTQREIAKKLSISQPHICRIIAKVLKSIANQLLEEGFIELNSENKILKKKQSKK